MPTFKINTLGCKVNQSESDQIAKELQAGAWKPVRNNEASEMVVINTCTVTQNAAMQSRQAVRRAIRSNPDARNRDLTVVSWAGPNVSPRPRAAAAAW